MAVPKQLIGCGHADLAPTHDRNAHGGLLDQRGGELKGWVASAIAETEGRRPVELGRSC